MRFIDSCEMKVVAGKGGDGAIAFRREKYIPFGGPAGGDGGRGGDIVFEADPNLSTLWDLPSTHVLRAGNGENGKGKDAYGKSGKDLIWKVPLGTQVFEQETGELLADFTVPHAQIILARGGRGGRGNIHFATSIDQAPRRAEPGQIGEERLLWLELKVLADVGLLGFPNVGKSSLIRVCSRARPKVADYPFTTLVPHLGVVKLDDYASFVMADIPGIVPGASQGIGLGTRFLKHVERTKVLLHIITLDETEQSDPFLNYQLLQEELVQFNEVLADHPTLVAMSKADLPEVRNAYPVLKKRFEKIQIDLKRFSSATGEGVRDLLFALYPFIKQKESDPLEPSNQDDRT
ncbi:GTPase ObgE [Pajaroellobacter abortibovis]|uniref:GTPase Obg n=1 Tax=Pajaroellobacter abortibovis TaxID=1882918 RepID=A0A1L6MVL1_9BACT|nr:GTPase ObgE [Pajaroellobacter abortibovis]APR99579.1 GTPase ObgE [Pajaroellobacter abortibovis]